MSGALMLIRYLLDILDQRIPATNPPIKVAAIPMMARDKGDRFPVSFSSWLAGAGSTVFVEVWVTSGLGVTVVGTTVMIFICTTVMTTCVCVGMGVSVTEGLTENRRVGEMVLEGVNKVKGAVFA